MLVTNQPDYDVEFHLPDILSDYEKEYGHPPMIEQRASDPNSMIRESLEPGMIIRKSPWSRWSKVVIQETEWLHP